VSHSVPAEIVDVVPLRGATLGPDLLRVHVRHAPGQVAVALDAKPVVPVARHDDGSDAWLWIPIGPRRREDLVRVTLVSLTTGHVVIPNARAEWVGTVVGPGDAAINGEGQIARITRALLWALGRYAAPTARLAHVVDLDAEGTGVRLVPVGDVPSLTLAGPRPELHRIATPERPTRETLLTPDGVQRIERTTGVSVDLIYELTGAARTSGECLATLSTVATFLARTRWLEIPRDPRVAGSPLLRWDLDADDGFKTEVTAGVHLWRLPVRVRDVVTTWPLDAGPEGS
jgi:hypothetical protein